MVVRPQATSRPDDRLIARCTRCREVVPARAPIVNFGDLQFHRKCRPACSTCGRPLGGSEGGWRSEGQIVSEPWGYGLRPSGFWCPECLGNAPRDEPRANQ